MKSKKLKKIIAIAIASSITSTIMPVAASAEWLQNSTNNWSFVEDGNKTAGWKQVEGKWYYFDNNGDMKTGWVQSSDSKWYYLNSDGAMKTGWLQTSDGKWYNLAPDGAMRTGWIKESDGNWYKLSTSGEMQTGWIKDSNNKWYFASSSGEMQTGVIQVEGKSYALSENGDMLVGANVLTEGNTYTTDVNGVIVQGSSSTRGKEFNNEGIPLAYGESSGDGKQSTTTSNTQSSNTDTTTTTNNTDNNSRHHNSLIGIAKINELNDINVSNGTILSEINLPKNVTVTLENNKEISVAVTWNEGNTVYDKNKSGSYTFSGTLTLPRGIKNSANLKATVNVNVGAAEVKEKSVINVHSISDINVNDGTSLDELNLPRNVHVTLSDNTTTSAAVTWNEGTPTYDGSAAGTYIFIGQLKLPEDVTNPNNVIATVNVNVASANIGDREILRVHPIADINVNNGTSLEHVDLPNRVRLTLGDNTTTSAAVTWDEGTPTYDENTAGTYIFSGELTLPEGITNPNNLKAIAQVNVAAAEIEKSVVSVNQILDINVSNGTSLDAENLPSDVIVRLDDHTTTSAAVTWDEGTPTYDESTAGTYIFSGELTLPEGVVNPNNLKATANVNVAATDIQKSVITVDTIPDINVSNGTSLDAANLPSDVIVRLDDHTTTSAAVTWNEGTPTYDGSAAGTYIFEGTLTLPQGITNPNNLTATANVIVENPIVATGMTATVNPKTTPQDGRVMLTVTSVAEDANHKVYYRILDRQPTPMNVGTVINPAEWREVEDMLPHEISAENGLYVEVVEVTTGDDKVTKWGKSSVTNDGYVAPTVKVSNLAFADTDTDASQIGGTLTWDAPTDVSKVTGYGVYASTDGITKGAKIGTDVPVGTNQLVIPENTPFTSHIIVVAKNADGEAESVNYVSVGVTDVIPVQPATFVVNTPITANNGVNDDGNSMVTVTWIDSTTPTVDHYEIVAKVGSAPTVTDTVTGKTNIAVGIQTASFEWAAGEDLYVGVVAVDRNGLKKLCTGATGDVVIAADGHTPVVPTVKVSNLAFTDTDTDASQIGGTLAWDAPTDVSKVTGYAVYASTDGTTKGTQIGSDVAVGTNQLTIPANTPITAYIIVVAKNADGEAESVNYASVGVTDVIPMQPEAFAVNTPTTANNGVNDDGKSTVTVTWTDSTTSTIDHYEIVAKVGSAPAVTDTVSGKTNIAVGIQTASFEWAAGEDLYVGVVAVDRNGLKKLCTGATGDVVIAADGHTPVVPTVKVSNLAFADTDTDASQIGGTLTWDAPTDVSNITGYTVYTSTDGTTKGAKIGSDVPVGTNQLVIPANTPLTAYIIVVAKNADGEAESVNYASVGVTDVQSLVTPTLIADTTNANVENNIEITFTDNLAWRNAVTDVLIDGVSAGSAGSGNWTLDSGKLTLSTSAITSLHTAGSKVVKIIASGYNDATVTQTIAAGAFNTTRSTVSYTPSPLTVGSTSTVTVTAKDQYDNPIAGREFKFELNTKDTTATTNEAYVIDSSSYTNSISWPNAKDLKSTTGGDGTVSFGITIPTVVDAGDGFDLIIKDTNSETPVGNTISYTNPMIP